MINLPTRPDRRDAITLAAALTGIDIEFVNGVSKDIDIGPLPPGGNEARIANGSLRCWRAHLNVVRR